MIQTKIDELLTLLSQKKRMTFEEAAKLTELKELEKIAQVLDKAGRLRLNYPINIAAKPWIEFVEQPVEKKEEVQIAKEIESYEVAGLHGHIQTEVKIIYSVNEKRPLYYVRIPGVSTATRAYFDAVKNEISKKTPIGKLEDEEEFQMHHSFISAVLEKDLLIQKKHLGLLCGILLREMYGLGDLDILIADENLEEIVINSSRFPVAVYHRKYGWMKTNITLANEDEVENYAAQIARKIGKQISMLNPILDAHLTSGDRVNATLFPVSNRGNTLTLRLFARNPWTMVSLLLKKQNALSLEMAALLWQAIHYEMNIIVSGGTASGKTSALNALVSLVQPHHRVISIEDTRELSLPSYQWNWVPMVTRAPNPEGLGEITMLDLVVNALRMRPDRIVMGEIRRRTEAEVLFEAMHTGHSVYATLHADTGAQVLKRLMEPPIEIPPSEVEDVHLLLVQYRDRRKNIRRTLELSEVVPGPDGPELNRIFTWKPRTDNFQLVKNPHRYMEQMNLHTGMTEKEINEDQQSKQKILGWMADNNIVQMDDVGAIMQIYYSEPDDILKAAIKNIHPTKVL